VSSDSGSDDEVQGSSSFHIYPIIALLLWCRNHFLLP